MGSAATGEPPSREFIRLYHLSSCKHAINNIRNGRLKIAQFKDLNDPFEFRALAFHDKNVCAAVKKFGKDFGVTTGLLCFSEDWTSPVMWSHYAESHRGICLGFDVRRSATRKVVYKSKRLEMELTSDEYPLTLSSEMQRNLVRVKCYEWAYECERRMLVPLGNAVKDNDTLFQPFNDNLHLREVIVGANCKVPLDDVQELAARYRGVRSFGARLA